MRIKKRIEFTDIQTERFELQEENPDENGGNDDVENEDSSELLSVCAVDFRLDGENLNGHGAQYAAVVTDETGRTHPAMAGWPEVQVNFSVADGDIPRVLAWFDDDYHGVTASESALLQKNRATAVHSALDTYLSAARSANLFTAPFRVAWCFRFADGSVSQLQHVGVLHTFAGAPKLPVVYNHLDDKYLTTRAQVRNIPARLMIRIASLPEPESLAKQPVALEIYATRQTDLFDKNGEVAGIRTATIDGTPRRCWHYDRYADSDVLLAAAADSDFRLLSSLSLDEIDTGDVFLPVPLAAGTLSDFSHLPIFGAGVGETPTENPVGTRIRIVTAPMHLGYPENEKSMRGVALRGIFDRRNVSMRLYASQHREHWHMSAAVWGPYLRGLHSERRRWFRLEIDYTPRPGDRLDALTSDFALRP